MNEHEHPYHGHVVRPAEAVKDLQKEVRRAGWDGCVISGVGDSVCLRAPVEYGAGFLQLLFKLKSPAWLLSQIKIAPYPAVSPGQSSIHPSRFGEEMDRKFAEYVPWSERLVEITFIQSSMLPLATACAGLFADQVIISQEESQA